MFGLVCSGRPVMLAQQVENLKFVFNIPNASSISHVSLFILPDTPFDPNYTALIYFQLPPSSTNPNPEFQLLGSVSQQKPSAIFKIKTNNNSQNNNAMSQIDDEIMVEDEEPKITQLPEGNDILSIGISIEPTEIALQQLNQIKESRKMLMPKPETASDIAKKDLKGTALLANKIVSNAYDYLGGFVDDNNKVPMKAMDSWWSSFKNKLQRDPKFLDN